jgi:NAD(P)-dependent dehydrogenase (short-subunit alcohol dehydrogenase family)
VLSFGRQSKPQNQYLLLELASEGYSLALGDLSSKQDHMKDVASECIKLQKIAALGVEPKLYYGPCDVSVESQVESLVQKAVDELGGIDVVSK